MVADVTETRNVIPSLEFKTCMTIKSYYCFISRCTWSLQLGPAFYRGFFSTNIFSFFHFKSFL